MSRPLALEFQLKYGWTRPGVDSPGDEAGISLHSSASMYTRTWQPSLNALYRLADGRWRPWVSAGLGVTRWEIRDLKETEDAGVWPRGEGLVVYDEDGNLVDGDGLNATAIFGLIVLFNGGDEPVPAPEPGKSLVLEGVNFEINKAVLLPESRSVLDRVAAGLLANPNVKVEVAGHADITGTAQRNRVLSQERAEAVRQHLIDRGVAADRLTAQGYSYDRPIADNATEEGRARNRRVELVRIED